MTFVSSLTAKTAVFLASFSFLTVSVAPSRGGDIRDDIRDVHKSLIEDVNKAKQVFAEKVASEGNAAIKLYERLAARAVREGDLSAATTAWREILRLNQDHKGAQDFFKSLGRLEDELKKIADEPGTQSIANVMDSAQATSTAALEGTRWSYEGNRVIEFRKGNSCVISNGRDAVDTRMWSVDSLGNVFISSNDGKFIVTLSFRGGNSYGASSFTKTLTFSGKKLE